MYPFWNFCNWNAPQGQVDPSMWNSMARSGPQHPGMGGFISGCDPSFHAAQQQQAQSQAQIDFLRQQNLLLNQQLATQAASHIQHLQQTAPPQPTIPPSTHPTPPPTPHPAQTPPQPPADTPPSTSTPSKPTDEILQKMSADLRADIASSFRDLRAQQQRHEDDRRDFLAREAERHREDIPAHTSPPIAPTTTHPQPPPPPSVPAPQPLHPSTPPSIPPPTMPGSLPLALCPAALDPPGLYMQPNLPRGIPGLGSSSKAGRPPIGQTSTTVQESSSITSQAPTQVTFFQITFKTP